ncbi:hypothetical protein, partial [Actinomycetospora sp.]|uniref:hypothetical protein n=1 Tax=Actinomycetospora sp. TaxID=1872135 RepID=UPI002F3ED17F
MPSPSDVVVSFTVDPSDPFDVLDFTDELDDLELDDLALDDFALDDLALVDFALLDLALLDFEALEPALLLGVSVVADFALGDFALGDFALDEVSADVPVGSALADFVAAVSDDFAPGFGVVAPAVLFAAVALGSDDGPVAEPVSSVDSFAVVTSTVEASAERVVVCVVRSRVDGSVRVERVVTAPDDGSTERARVVTTPVDGSVTEPDPSGAVVTCGPAVPVDAVPVREPAVPVGSAPVVVVIESDE